MALPPPLLRSLRVACRHAACARPCNRPPHLFASSCHPQVGPGQYVGQVALLPSDPAAAAVAASGAALTAALAGLPASGAAAAAGVVRRLSEDEFELYLEVRPCCRRFKV